MSILICECLAMSINLFFFLFRYQTCLDATLNTLFVSTNMMKFINSNSRLTASNNDYTLGNTLLIVIQNVTLA